MKVIRYIFRAQPASYLLPPISSFSLIFALPNQKQTYDGENQCQNGSIPRPRLLSS